MYINAREVKYDSLWWLASQNSFPIEVYIFELDFSLRDHEHLKAKIKAARLYASVTLW